MSLNRSDVMISIFIYVLSYGATNGAWHTKTKFAFVHDNTQKELAYPKTYPRTCKSRTAKVLLVPDEEKMLCLSFGLRPSDVVPMR